MEYIIILPVKIIEIDKKSSYNYEYEKDISIFIEADSYEEAGEKLSNKLSNLIDEYQVSEICDRKILEYEKSDHKY